MSTVNASKSRLEQYRRELARRCYADYLPYVHGSSWKKTRMSQFLAEKVQEFLEAETGHAYDILIIETPPQHGKSMTITETLPSWYLGRHPDKRVIEVSYNVETSERFCRANKDKIKRVGKNLFGIEIGPVDRSNNFILKSGGSMLSAGVLAGITGNPADLMIIDDPIKNRQEADSETTRSQIWAEWRSSMMSRFQAHAKVILIMTPWHEDDIAARLIEMEKEYVTLIRLPVEALDDDPLGRAKGEPLCPEIGKDATWLAQFKHSYLNGDDGGTRAWNALYMCSPTIEGGNMVLRDWWKFYDPTDEELQSFGTTYISVDATFKDDETSDFVVIQVWSKLRGGYYLRYNCKQHLDFPNTVKKIKEVRRMFPDTNGVLIEDKANGSAIIQVLQREMSNVIPVTPLGGKIARVNAVSTFIEVGHVFLPQTAPWLEDYLKEWTEFPAGKHDDQVDATTQALSYLQYAWDLPRDSVADRQLEEDQQDRNTFFGLGEYNPYDENGSTLPDYDEDVDSYDWFGNLY